MILSKIFKPVKCMDIDTNKPVETTMINELMRFYMMPFAGLYEQENKPEQTKTGRK